MKINLQVVDWLSLAACLWLGNLGSLHLPSPYLLVYIRVIDYSAYKSSVGQFNRDSRYIFVML